MKTTEANGSNVQEQNEIYDEAPRTNFTMLPHMVIRIAGMSSNALKLYIWYKAVCGEKPDNRCWMSLSTIARFCHLTEHTVIKCRSILEQMELISVVQKRNQTGQVYYSITIRDIWKENSKHKLLDEDDIQTAYVSPAKGATGPAKQATATLQREQPAPAKQADKEEYSGTRLHLTNNTLSAGADEACSEEENTNSLFEDFVEPSPTKQNARKKAAACEIDPKKRKYFEDAAHYLFRKLVEKNKIPKHKPPNLNNWSIELLEFFEGAGLDKSDFAETFRWYCDHIGEDHVSHAYSASGFCGKFFSIQGQMGINNRITNSNGSHKNAADLRFDEFLRNFDSEV